MAANTGKGGLANLSDRIADIARRCGDLKPATEPVRKILFNGNRENKRKGLAQDGRKYAPLAASTIKRRPRPGNLPFITKGDQSAVIRDYHLDIRAGTGKLTFTASYPGTFWAEYHERPTHNRPARPLLGFRTIDLRDIKEMMGAYVTARQPNQGKTTSPIAKHAWWKIWQR